MIVPWFTCERKLQFKMYAFTHLNELVRPAGTTQSKFDNVCHKKIEQLLR